MKESDDIANLFKQFGGQPSQYQEIGRANEARQSRERWPLLSSIDADHAAQFPPVDASESSRPSSPQPEPVRAQPAPASAAPAPAGELAAFRLHTPHAERIEPHLSPELPPRAVRPAAPTPAPAPVSAPVAATPPPARPAAEFIPPRPRGPQGQILSPAFTRPVPAAEPAPVPAAVPVPPPRPFASAAEPGGASSTRSDELSNVFARLSQPQQPNPVQTEDKNASLLHRLNRL